MQRLYLNSAFVEGRLLALEPKQEHYLLRVLRLKEGDKIAIFNGQQGEWLAKLVQAGKKTFKLEAVAPLIPQSSDPVGGDIIYCFAPLKQARLDYLIQKAIELGTSNICAIKTTYTQIKSLNISRIEANIIEAAEQCQALSLAKFSYFECLKSFLNDWDEKRLLFFCDEKESEQKALPVLLANKAKKIGVLIGPEGGFSSEERALLRQKSFVKAVSLGSRILRAETAGLAFLSLANAVIQMDSAPEG